MKYGNRAANAEATCIVLTGNAQGAPLTTAITPAAQTAAIDGGLYDLWCDASVYVKIAAIANDVTTSSGYLLRANTTIRVMIPDDSLKIGAIGAIGTLSYHKVN